MKSTSPIVQALVFYGTRVQHPGKWRVLEALRKTLHAEVNEDLEITRNGLRFALNPSDHQHKDIFWYGAADRWTIHHLVKLTPPGAVVLDIGANIGYISVALAQAVKRNCHIHAFEPNPPTFKKLRRNIELNNLQDIVATHQLALSDTVGTGYIIESAGHSGAASIGFNNEGVEIPTTTLDHFCDLNKMARLDLMKVDIEGFEEKFLRGAQQTFAKFLPRLCIELNPNPLQRAGSSLQKVIGLLQEYKMEMYVAKRDQLTPLKELPASGDYVNAFCFPKGTKPA